MATADILLTITGADNIASQLPEDTRISTDPEILMVQAVEVRLILLFTRLSDDQFIKLSGDPVICAEPVLVIVTPVYVIDVLIFQLPLVITFTFLVSVPVFPAISLAEYVIT